jgi:hypothetical protein
VGRFAAIAHGRCWHEVSVPRRARYGCSQMRTGLLHPQSDSVNADITNRLFSESTRFLERALDQILKAREIAIGSDLLAMRR